MHLFWKIRYLDAQDKQFKDRNLWLDTRTLDDANRAAIELLYELNNRRHQRKWLQYRHLFHEHDIYEKPNRCNDVDKFGSVFLFDYFEDETGNELSSKQIAVILTDKPGAMIFWAGTKQHDIDYHFADKKSIDIASISPLTDEQLIVLGYFSRDLREMSSSAFYKDGSATLSRQGTKQPELKTSVSDEEIRSFVTIFRRLYMQKEPANFLKASKIFIETLSNCPIGNWAIGATEEYETVLTSKPDFVPYVQDYPFTRKRIIDVFLYTQYAHQPSEQRSRQFQECLSEADNNEALLTWLFLSELHRCSLHILNVGNVIAGFYSRYCQCHRISPVVLESVAKKHPGIGVLEKQEDRQERLIQEKAKDLALSLWKNNGGPEGGPEQFTQQAHEQLKKSLNRDN